MRAGLKFGVYMVSVVIVLFIWAVTIFLAAQYVNVLTAIFVGIGGFIAGCGIVAAICEWATDP